MPRNKGKRLKFLKGEKLMLSLILVLAVLIIPLSKVYTASLVTKTNLDVEVLKKDITKQQEKNESLSMQIDELASLDNIQAVAKEYGLSYNDTNILSIN